MYTYTIVQLKYLAADRVGNSCTSENSNIFFCYYTVRILLVCFEYFSYYIFSSNDTLNNNITRTFSQVLKFSDHVRSIHFRTPIIIGSGINFCFLVKPGMTGWIHSEQNPFRYTPISHIFLRNNKLNPYPFNADESCETHQPKWPS